MRSTLTEHPVTTWNLPYDNTALRERIGGTEIVTRSVGAELHSAARAATATDVLTRSRGRWRLQRGQR